MAVSTLQIELPPLHKGRDGLGGQQEVFDHPARFKVICCGRRWGKTTLGVTKGFKDAFEGKRIWWVAPTYKVAFVGWRMTRHLARQLKNAGLEVDIREADRYIVFPGGGEFWVKSADDPDSLRGEGLDGVIFDEAAYTKQAAWSEAIRPALSDKLGWAIFIGTPNGKNWFYNLFNLAQSRPDWMAWRKPTSDNPFISLDEIEAAKEEFPSLALFQQEYEADFGASQLQVYPDYNRTLHQWRWEIPQFEAFIGGLDFGGTTIGSHKSAGVFGGIVKNTDIIVELKEFEQAGPRVGENQIEWMGECEALGHKLTRKFTSASPPIFWHADKTQFRFIEMMRTAGYSISPSKGGPDSVSSGIQLVQNRLKIRSDGRARIYLSPDLSLLPDAIERYRYPELKDETSVQAKNPLKVNDDLIDAFRYQIEGKDLYIIGDPQELYANVLPGVR